MNIEVNGKRFDTTTLQFVAHYQNMDDRSSYNYYQEILFRAVDGTYIVHCSGNGGSIHGKLQRDTWVKSTNLKFEPAPDKWLLAHGHERLAGFIMPEARKQIEMKLHTWGIMSAEGTGEVFYTTGAVKGEVNNGN